MRYQVIKNGSFIGHYSTVRKAMIAGWQFWIDFPNTEIRIWDKEDGKFIDLPEYDTQDWEDLDPKARFPLIGDMSVFSYSEKYNAFYSTR
jgi:hypothetical protein